jgi:hypothetical protein
VPAPPTTIAPAGDVQTTTPTFRWNELPGCSQGRNATWYRLRVELAGGNDKVYAVDRRAADICSSGVCLVTPGQELPAGDYTWLVIGRSPGGWGEWSAERAFSVILTPGQVQTVAPSGDLVCQRLIYDWLEEPAADAYELQVVNGVGTVLDESFDNGVCAGGQCSAAPLPDPDLPPAAYTWLVRGSNASGDGPWSVERAFNLLPLPAAAPLAPVSDSFETQPDFSWQEVEHADEYRRELQLWNGAVWEDVTADPPWQAAGDLCGGGVCQETGELLTCDEDYRWRVRSRRPNCETDTDESSAPWQTFSLTRPIQGPPLNPTADRLDDEPAFRWQRVPQVPEYQLEIERHDGADWQPEYQSAWEDAAMICSDDACQTGTGGLLTPGDYRWRALSGGDCGSDPSTDDWQEFAVLTCNGAEDEVLDGDDSPASSPAEPIQGCSTITAGSGYTVGTGIQVTFHAGSSVALEDGFTVEAGGELTVIADP